VKQRQQDLRQQQRVAAKQAPFLEDERGVESSAHAAGGAGVALAALAEAGDGGGVASKAGGVPPYGGQEGAGGDDSPDQQIRVEAEGGAGRKRDDALGIADDGHSGVEHINHRARAGLVLGETRHLGGDEERRADEAAEDLRGDARVLRPDEREQDAREHERDGGGEQRQQQNGGREAEPGPTAEERQPHAHGGNENEVEDADID